MKDYVYVNGVGNFYPKEVFWPLMQLCMMILGPVDEDRLSVLVAAFLRDEVKGCSFIFSLYRYKDGCRGVEIPDYIASCMPCR